MNNSIQTLTQNLCYLPGIGPKTAQRLTYFLLERGKDIGFQLAKTLQHTLQSVTKCKQCRNFTETELCHICANPKRDKSLLCIVETPLDIVALEQTNAYQGLYFVLMGHLSPLDGIGPKEIGLTTLQERLSSDIKEVIIATNTTVEGEATAHYLANLINAKKITCTRIAHGIPMGGELEYLDSNTISYAFSDRKKIS